MSLMLLKRNVNHREPSGEKHRAAGPIAQTPPHTACQALANSPVPGRVDIRSLIPRQQLETIAAAAAGSWRSLGTDPQFVAPCVLPAGWIRIRLQMASAIRGRVEILVDTGSGFDQAECVERTSIQGIVDREFFVRLPRPAWGLRLDPLDGEGEFRLKRFQVTRVATPVALGHALWTKLQLLLRYHRIGRALWNGLGLLVRGRWGRFARKIYQALKGPSPLAPPLEDAQTAYDCWRRNRQLHARDRRRMRAEAAALAGAPIISVLMPVGERSIGHLRQTIESVLGQIYPHWELCVGVERGAPIQLRSLLEEFACRDRRIQVRGCTENGGSAAAWRAAFGQATGDYVALLGQADELAEQALFGVAKEIAASRPDIVYTDEDQIDGDGRHHAPFFKPDWSPEYMLSWAYTGGLAVFRTALVHELGGIREGFEGAVDDDLALRVAATTERVSHVADVLYHRRSGLAALAAGNPQAAESRRRAWACFLETTGRRGLVQAGPAPGLHRVRLAIVGRPKISILIPTAYRQGMARGQTSTYLSRCLTSIRARSTYRHYEILVLDNDMVPPELRDVLAKWGVTRIPYALPFNWARTMNAGAALATGEQLVFLDDDTEVITPEWLECLLEYSQQPGVGAVGARLEFPDGRLQHAGVTILGGLPGHPFYGAAANHPGYFFSNVVPRNYSAVTSACLMTRAEVFREAGGFSEEYACNFNDIDYCLRVRDRGLRVVCNPYARLHHHETATKAEFLPAELNAFKARWARSLAKDPFHNPNLSSRYNDFRVEPEPEMAEQAGP